ncbi:proline-rich receptor-like protein kinase PERK2 [Gastrolobium bilobum]|uniref:proline-rich receptor-like protein kinase PERK2 n=1 Tax=Gastrolobium bilobum TaxID=150636 RepID=UPI002AAF63F6|nr:proline-rich receptor-like protein kinase PERK2 [Gastrolobium bilobum]
MPWFLVILFLSLTFCNLSEASHDKKLPSAVVVGTVYCDTCFQHDFSMGSHFISGASVAVECKDGNSKPRFKKEVKTDEHGEFKVKLPFSVRKHVKRMKGCTFKLISSSEPNCAVASAATSSLLSLKSRKNGEHIFSAGFFSFKPIKKPNLCDQKQSIPNSKGHGYVKNELPPNIPSLFPPPIGGLPSLPPLPRVPMLPPLPQVSPMPPFLGTPLLPPPVQGKTKGSNPTKTSDISEDFFFPPNPFLPPPIIPNPFQPPPLIPNPFQPPPLIPNPFQPPSPPPLIPNPFQPPSPPPLIPNPFQPPSPPPLIPNPFKPPPSNPPPLIPNPFQPPPSSPPPLFPFPPITIPGLTPPPPPPPPPPFFPFPFPPLFPPPRSPGTPPTSSKKTFP